VIGFDDEAGAAFKFFDDKSGDHADVGDDADVDVMV